MTADPAPVRPPQTRVGNAMGRSRAAAVAGARRVLAERGVRKATMGEVAVRGGLAKATLYNHVRTKEELLALVVDDGVARVRTAAETVLAGGDLGAALGAAAAAVAEDDVVVALRRSEPAALLALASPGEGAGWDGARGDVADLLARGGRASDPAQVELVLRWLTSYVLSPGTSAGRAAGAGLLAASLPAVPSRTSFAPTSSG